MKTHAKATFTLNAWDEKPYNEMNAVPKLTRAGVTKSYQGDITGEGKLEYLMMYRDDGSASLIGLERVVGSVGGRSEFGFGLEPTAMACRWSPSPDVDGRTRGMYDWSRNSAA